MSRQEELQHKLTELEESLKTHEAALEYTITDEGKKAAQRLIATLKRQIELLKDAMKG